MKNKAIILSILISFLLVQNGLAQSRLCSIAINPAKILMALINLDFEYRLSSQIAIHISGEYLIIERDHPDLVIRLGPRYYFSANEYDQSGFYSGLNLGYLWYIDRPKESSSDIGVEFGYEWLIRDSIFMLPRGLIATPIKSPKPIPGFEVLLGIRHCKK